MTAPINSDTPASTTAAQLEQIVATAGQAAAVIDPKIALALAAFNAILTAAQTFLPLIEQLKKEGVISVADQQAQADQIEKIRNHSAFDGVEWKL